MRIVILGSGNVATVLGQIIYLAPHDIVQVYSRSQLHAEVLAKKLHTKHCSRLEELDKDADIYIIAVSDDALPELARQLRVNDKMVMHTAGSVNADVLKECSENYGVLYPLQSIRSTNDLIPLIPLCVSGNNSTSLDIIHTFAGSLVTEVRIADDEQRRKLHIGAVVVNNFTNHLYSIVSDFCNNEGLDFRLYHPLISETAERIQHLLPQQVQTGPAIRQDQTTIDLHLKQLEEYPDIKEIYALFTARIRNYYK